MSITGNSIGEYDLDSDWSAYIQRMKLYFLANGIVDKLQPAVLLTMMGAKAFDKIRVLCAPKGPESLSLDDIISLMENKGSAPKRTKIAARFQFGQRRQQEGENISDFHLELKRLTQHCIFGTTLEDRLMEQIVAGLRDKSIQEALLSVKDLTYEKTLETALSRECASRDAGVINTQQASVYKVYNKKPRSKCECCGKTNHRTSDCYFKDSTCHNCKKPGHIQTVCPQPKRRKNEKKNRNVRQVEAHEAEDDTSDNTQFDKTIPMKALKINKVSVTPFLETLDINGIPLTMEIDTGAAVSVIGAADMNKLNLHNSLRNTDVTLSTYTKEPIKPLGVCQVNVKYKSKNYGPLELYVLESTDVSPLLGRTWLKEIRLDWSSIKRLAPQSQPNSFNSKDIKAKYADLFSDSLGAMKNFKARIEVKPDARPRFLRARPVPLSQRAAVITDIDRLEEDGIISPVRHSDWATPIVPIVKTDGSLRICGDFKVTVNPVLITDQYPQPRREELFACLAGGKQFSKIDLASAYLQMELEEESKVYLTINTPKGLYRYNRLAFGIASAPAIFQRAIETILQGIPGTLVYQDDILITGPDYETHLKSLHKALCRLQEHNLRVKPEKCAFFAPEITYLGHRINEQGVSTVQEKVKGIMDAPTPQSTSELRSFLGTVNYYGSFIHDLSTKLSPLNQLLRKGVKFHWTKECQESFDLIKRNLCTAPVLAHYDPKLPLVVACDASPYGVAAVLSHRYQNGSEKPIAYASRTLTQAEKNYAQVDREALAVVYGVKKFHEYLYGQKFILVTDNRPVTHIFSPQKSTPGIAAARIQRWAVFLGAHQYSIEHRPAAKHSNVDGLSRLPVPTKSSPSYDIDNTWYVNHVGTLPISSTNIATETRKDPVLSLVYQFTVHGWENTRNTDGELKHFHRRHMELTVYNGVIMWGSRVVVPAKYRSQILSTLHEGHPGIVKMKALARSYVYWPNIDQQLEQTAASCKGCISAKKMPTTAPLHQWEWPSHPWRRLHIDFAGPLLNRMFLVVVDAHSKWPEVFPKKNATSAATIEALRNMWARFGIPDQVVSDNGPQFISAEFQEFLQSNGVRHIKSAPYHPATNGLAERFVQSLKSALKAASATETTACRELSKFLMAYRNAPHSTTGASPSMLLIGRSLRTRLDLLNPTCDSRVLDKQTTAMQRKSGTLREFEDGESVHVRGYSGDKWVQGNIISRKGPVTYKVQVPGEKKPWSRHVDQMLRDHSGTDITEDIAFRQNPRPHTSDTDTRDAESTGIPQADSVEENEDQSTETSNDHSGATTEEQTRAQHTASSNNTVPTEPVASNLRRSARQTKKPQRYSEEG